MAKQYRKKARAKRALRAKIDAEFTQAAIEDFECMFARAVREATHAE